MAPPPTSLLRKSTAPPPLQTAQAFEPSRPLPHSLPVTDSGTPTARAREAPARSLDPPLVAVPSLGLVGVTPTPVGLGAPPHAAVPRFGVAMKSRVRFGGGEVPVWSLVTPLILVAALASALAASAVSGRRGQDNGTPESPSPSLASSVVTNSPAQGDRARNRPDEFAAGHTQSAPENGASPVHSANRAQPGVGATADHPGGQTGSREPYTALQLIARAETRSRGALAAAREFDAVLDHDPGLITEEKTQAELRRLSENPETARVVLGAVAKLPAPVAADILYEFWTGTGAKNETTELARSLLYSRDVRPKVSAALAVALDLRSAEECEDAKAILPRAQKDGDRRSLHLFIKLQRKYGCGPNKRQDCYPCLRRGDELESVIKTVKARQEPRFLSSR